LDTINDIYLAGDYPDLSAPDDVGNTPAHLAVLFDRPEVLKWLHSKGVDLSKKCDSSNFGTPTFYAMHYGKTGMLTDLWAMGYDLSADCDKFELPPLYYAEKKGDTLTADHIKACMAAGTLQDVKATIIQRCTRGLFARNIYREKKAHRERQVLAQTIISAPWRGGVVRMRNNRRELEAEARDDEVDAKLNDETKTKNEDNNGGENAVEEEVQEETKT
ncbi:hypothetical protein TL16_g03568, partial [Triparma laevis f. inornata]